MPKYSNRAGLIQAEEKISLQQIDLPEIKIDGKNIGYDYHQQMAAVYQIREQTERGASETSLVVDLFSSASNTLALNSTEIGGEWQGISLLSQGEELLEQAKQLAQRHEYTKALAVIDQSLALEPSQEAVYLKAYCLVELRRAEEALVCLGELKNANLSPLLEAQINIIKERTRDIISKILPLEVFARTRIQSDAFQMGQLLNRLQRMTDIDPGMGMYHFFLSALLLETGQLEHALSAAQRGARETQTADRPQIEGFKKHVEELYLRKILVPAVSNFKQGRYAQSQAELKRIPPAFRGDARVQVFESYLLDLSSYSLKPGADLPAPNGAKETVLELYQLLVGEDVELATNLLNQLQLDRAEATLAQARKYTPAYPRVNFILANCVYMKARIQYKMRGGMVDKGLLAGQLAKALPFARIAAITEANGVELLKAIEHFHARLIEEKDADAVIHEFMSIMESTQGGIQNIEQFWSINRRMKELETRVRPVKANCVSVDILNALQQLDDLVTRNLKQLQAIEVEIRDGQHDSELVNKLAARYGEIMKQVQHGIQSLNQLETLQIELRTLKKEIGAAKLKLVTATGGQELDKIAGQVDARLQETGVLEENMQAQERERNIVEPLIKEYNDIMGPLTRRGISSQSELYDTLTAFLDIKKRAEAANRQVYARGSKDALNQLTDSIDRVLQQLGR